MRQEFHFNLGTEYGSPEFRLRYKAAVKGERLASSGETVERISQAPLGSLPHVIAGWYTSPDTPIHQPQENYT